MLSRVASPHDTISCWERATTRSDEFNIGRVVECQQGLIADVVTGTAERFDVLAKIPQLKYPGDAMLREPTLALGFFYIWLRDRLRDL